MKRRRGSGARVCASFASALVLLLLGCTPRPGPADPFAGGASSERRGGQQYRVRFEVACENCTITYMVGPNASSARTDRTWTRTLTIAPLQRTALTLVATPEQDGRPIRFVRILIDGEVAAEQGCANCRDGTAQALERTRAPVSVEAIIPRG